jgi:hypothetical protein
MLMYGLQLREYFERARMEEVEETKKLKESVEQRQLKLDKERAQFDERIRLAVEDAQQEICICVCNCGRRNSQNVNPTDLSAITSTQESIFIL